jgi:recombination protein RecA
MADALDTVLKGIEKTYGEGTARILADTEDLNVERVSSGSLNLDLAIGGGFPLSRVIELYGPESGGKTTIALLTAREMQKKFPNKYILFDDVEHALDPELVAAYGIDTSRFIHCQGETAEKNLDLVESFMRSGTCSLIIVDSVSALCPEFEANADVSQNTIGLQARLMSKYLRKITPLLQQFDTTIIFLNQLREKVGVMYGNPETTSGGRALAFYSSVRVHIRPGEKIPDPKAKDQVMGHVVNVRCTKNKTARPHRVASFPLIYAVGVDKISELADIVCDAGVVQKAGAWIRIMSEDGKTPIVRKVEGKDIPVNFQGKEKFINYLYEDLGLCELFERAISGEVISLDEYRGGTDG